jgi:hypothetical protein
MKQRLHVALVVQKLFFIDIFVNDLSSDIPKSWDIQQTTIMRQNNFDFAIH